MGAAVAVETAGRQRRRRAGWRWAGHNEGLTKYMDGMVRWMRGRRWAVGRGRRASGRGRWGRLARCLHNEVVQDELGVAQPGAQARRLRFSGRGAAAAARARRRARRGQERCPQHSSHAGLRRAVLAPSYQVTRSVSSYSYTITSSKSALTARRPCPAASGGARRGGHMVHPFSETNETA